jgi:hypothetical protein
VTPDLETRIDSAALTEARLRSIVSERPLEALPVGYQRRWTMRGRKIPPTLYLPTMHD